ncbi:MAG TPA: C-GCAxxG-C-C family protein [Candidatus Atribacteria bacterium]|nr:C-GCAxxG-C-C family protein [Candidatus Atribacteria bacterium]
MTSGEYHDQGFNCCESILQGLGDYLGVKSDLIPSIATGFGGGIGHTGGICGAITGAVMALGIKYGRKDPRDKEKRDWFYKMVENFLQDAEKELGSLSCRDLIGLTLNTDETMKIYREKNLRRKCHEIISQVEKLAQAYLSLSYS